MGNVAESTRREGEMGLTKSGWRLRSQFVLALAVIAWMGMPVELHAHLALSSASPAAGSTAAVAPLEIRLTFTEAVELSLSTLNLIGATGEVRLGALSNDNKSTELAASIEGTLVPGRYTVRWQAVGLDGHPVRGEYDFEVAEPAVVTVPAITLPPEVEPTVEGAVTTAAFGPQSPVYAGVRWLMYVGLLGTIGAATFIVLLGSLSRTRPELSPTFAEGATRGAATLGLMASLVLMVSNGMRLQAQSYSVFDQGIDGRHFALLLESVWGSAWFAQMCGALVAMIGFLLVRRANRIGALLGGAVAVFLGFATAFSGHAAANASLAPVAVLADTVHVLGVGAWLGTLLVLFLIVIPRLRTQPLNERPAILAALLPAFSSIALTAGALIVASGVLAATLHLNLVSDLWKTPYGKLLTAKLCIVLIVFSAGALNWRRFRGKDIAPGTEIALGRRAAIELTAAALVVALTSFLVAVPPPADQIAADPTVTAASLP